MCWNTGGLSSRARQSTFARRCRDHGGQGGRALTPPCPRPPEGAPQHATGPPRKGCASGLGSRRWCAECRYSKAPWEMSERRGRDVGTVRRHRRQAKKAGLIEVLGRDRKPCLVRPILLDGSTILGNHFDSGRPRRPGQRPLRHSRIATRCTHRGHGDRSPPSVKTRAAPRRSLLAVLNTEWRHMPRPSHSHQAMY
jgi:hypothetical protein